MKLTLIVGKEMAAALRAVANGASKEYGKTYDEADVAMVAIDFWMRHRTTGAENVPDEGWSVKIDDLPEELRPKL